MSKKTLDARVLAVIPARGGSKGVARKNIRQICGKPLLAHTVETALAARHLFHRILVSTDDAEIAEVGRRYGADVPFLRPAELATDTTPTAPVLVHAVEWVEKADNVRLDWVCLLQPTAPLRTVEELERALALALEDQAGEADSEPWDSVISVEKVEAHHPILMKRIEDDRLLGYCLEEKEGTRRQDYDPPAYMRNGSIYLTRRDVLVESGSIWGQHIRPLVMPVSSSVSIDTELDFRLAELLLEQRTASPLDEPE